MLRLGFSSLLLAGLEAQEEAKLDQAVLAQ